MLRWNERGASAVLVAASMLVLLGFAALAVDSGLAFEERRLQQGAVDTGVLSAGLASQLAEPAPSTCTGSGLALARCKGAVRAVETINEALRTSLTMGQFDDSGRCPDSAFPASDLPLSGDEWIKAHVGGVSIDCIRWSELNMHRVRIILPVTDVETSFGKVLGRSEIEISAMADAEVTLDRPGTIIPFVLGPTGSATSACLFQPSAGISPATPCDGSGPQPNGAFLEARLYGDAVMGTPVECSPGDVPAFGATFAKGADHAYMPDALIPNAHDSAECINSGPGSDMSNKNQRVDHIDVDTAGYEGPAHIGALEADVAGTEGRLLCKSGGGLEPTWFDVPWSSTGCAAIGGGLTVDDTPLSDFSLGSGYSANILSSPRFAWVPGIGIDPVPGSHPVQDLVPVYVETMYLNCSGGSCEVVFEPGEMSQGDCATFFPQPCGWPSSAPSLELHALTARILSISDLPASVADLATDRGPLVYNLVE